MGPHRADATYLAVLRHPDLVIGILGLADSERAA